MLVMWASIVEVSRTNSKKNIPRSLYGRIKSSKFHKILQVFMVQVFMHLLQMLTSDNTSTTPFFFFSLKIHQTHFLFLKNTYSYQTLNCVFHFWKYVIRNRVPNTFFFWHYEHFKHMFFQHFLYHNIHTILKINT